MGVTVLGQPCLWPSRCFPTVTWLLPPVCHESVPAPSPPATCLPPRSPADSMIRTLASDFRLWDK